MDGEVADIDPLAIEGRRDSLDQSLDIAEWTAAVFIRVPNIWEVFLMGPFAFLGINGHIDTRVTGDHFDHHLFLEWSGELSYHATLSCL